METSIKRAGKGLLWIGIGGSFIILSAHLLVSLLLQDEWARMVVSDILYPLVGLLVSGVLFYTARQTAPHSRQVALAWYLLAAGQFCYALGDITWGVIELVLHQDVFPSPADAFYLLYYPIFILGMMRFPRATNRGETRLKTILDTGIVMLSALLVFWNFIIGPLFQAGTSEPLLGQAIALAYPVFDLVLLWALLALVFGQLKVSHPKPILLLIGGAVVLIVTDFIFDYQNSLGVYASGGLLDLGWLAAFVLTGLAGLLQVISLREPTPPIPGEGTARLSRLRPISFYLPYIWMGMAFLLLIADLMIGFPMERMTLTVSVGAIIFLVIARQVLVLRENHRLNSLLYQANDLLENRVRERTAELEAEIQERKRAEQKLIYGAFHDELTGLANRAALLQQLETAILRARRFTNYRFAVLFFDLDQFKVVNDSLGHSSGDELLIALASRLKTGLRALDMVARLGGDEFVVFLDSISTAEEAVEVASRILEEIKKPFSLSHNQVFSSSSIGIVLNSPEYENPEEILRDADTAMYRAKGLGKARYELFTPVLRTLAMTRLEMERDLHRAYEHGEFRLYYQPIANLVSGQLTGFEALLRWQHPERGLIYPDDFLPIAEETDLILQFTPWVLQEACRQIREWQRIYPTQPPLVVNVNLSTKQLKQKDLVLTVEETLRETGLAPECLALELTETAILDHAEATVGILNGLHSLGVRLQIDDFGTGYSSLGYLQSFPIDTIKIDRSFISRLGQVDNSLEIIRTIIMLARNLGMGTIAEGIEKSEQLAQLEALDCPQGQGFLLSEPLASDTATQFLKKVNEEGVIEFER